MEKTTLGAKSNIADRLGSPYFLMGRTAHIYFLRRYSDEKNWYFDG